MEMLVKTGNGTELRDVEDLNRDESHPGLWRANPVLRRGEEAFHGIGGDVYVVKMRDDQ